MNMDASMSVLCVSAAFGMFPLLSMQESLHYYGTFSSGRVAEGNARFSGLCWAGQLLSALCCMDQV